MEQTIRKVDHSALRVNQAFIIGLLVLAFVLDSLSLVLLVGAVMLVGMCWWTTRNRTDLRRDLAGSWW